MVKRSKIVLLLVYVLPWWCSITSALSPFPPALWFVVSGSQCTPPAPCSSGKQTSKPWAPQRDETEVLKEVQPCNRKYSSCLILMPGHTEACTGRPAWIHLMMCTWYSAEGLRFAAVSEVLFHFCVLLSFITISTPSPDLSLMKAAFPGPRGCIWLYFCLVFVSLPCNELIYVADSCTQFLMFGSRVEITCSCFSIVLMQTPMTSYYCSHV